MKLQWDDPKEQQHLCLGKADGVNKILCIKNIYMKRQIKCRNAVVMEPGCSWGCWQGQGVQQPLEEGAEGCSQLRGGMAMGCSGKEQWEPTWMEYLRSPFLLREQPDRYSPHAREGDYPSAVGCGTSFPSPPKVGCCFLPPALAPTSRRHHRISTMFKARDAAHVSCTSNWEK